MNTITLQGVSKVFGSDVVAVDDVSLVIHSGEFMVLVGPSGCGKTTLMRMIAGLEDVSAGSISIDSKDVTDVPARARDVAMVFQNYALYPHMTVKKNLGYGLKVRGTPRREIDVRVNEAARMLGLEGLLDRRPAELSGGQRQRVAMGRAIVRTPKVFLMDEPLSNLDAKLRVGMRAELARLHDRLGITTVYVTHDQVEAMTLGQRVAVMRAGRVQQVDTPQALYRQPANLFVASFIGSPSMNLVHATVRDDEISFAGQTLPLHPTSRPTREGAVVVGIRPHDLEETSYSEPNLPRIEVQVSVVELLGSETHLVFPLDTAPVMTEEVLDAQAEGEEPMLIADEKQALFTASVDPRVELRPGDAVALAVDPARFHFFDPASGQAITQRHAAVSRS